jgi:hypothetical protein
VKPSRFLARAFALALLLGVAAAAQDAPTLRTVTRPVLNMYSSASVDADVVSQAIYATNVTIVDQRDGWARIRTPDDYTGWVETSGLIARTGDPYPSRTSAVQVRSLFAHIYREDSVTKHAPLLTVPFETRLEIDPAGVATERWAPVLLPDGRRAMIQKGDVMPAGGILNIDDAIALAKRFVGLPYTWGGTSSYGYDCSGFTQMLMRQRGYLMPRDASVQARWTGLVPVERNELKPGDLLYFGPTAERITHTGMYIGDGLFINATTHDTPMVRIDNVNDPYWNPLLVAARRIRP